MTRIPFALLSLGLVACLVTGGTGCVPDSPRAANPGDAPTANHDDAGSAATAAQSDPASQVPDATVTTLYFLVRGMKKTADGST